MDLTIELIHYRLSLTPNITVTMNKKLARFNQIQNWMFFSDQPLDICNIYIADKTDIVSNPDKWRGCTLISITDSDVEYQDANFDIITVKPPVDVYYLANQLQLIFQDFGQWKNSIHEIIRTTCDIGHALELSQKLLPCLFAVVDDEFNLVAHTKELFDIFPECAETPGRLPLNITSGALSNQESTRLKNERDVFENYLESTTGANRDIALCYNVFIRGNYYARLIARGAGKDNNQGERYFVRCLGEFITEMCSESNSQNKFEQDYIALQETIRQFIGGIYQDKNTVKAILSTRSWLTEHQYQVYKFKFMREGFMLYYCRQLEQIFGNCCAVYMEDGIFCIRNISLTTAEDEEESRELLTYFERENLCKVGISNIFADIFQLSTYCHEANIALSLGEKVDKDSWSYHFSKYTMNYILNQCTSDLPAFNICHNALKVLKKYDEKNNTELYNTLYQLIKCKYNVTHAAESLFIHRTTLIQRLERIDKLTGIRLNNYEECLYLMLSYYLMMQR